MPRYIGAMRYVGVALLLVLAACSSSDGAEGSATEPKNDPMTSTGTGDFTTPSDPADPTTGDDSADPRTEPVITNPAPISLQKGQYLIVSANPSLNPTQVLGLTEGQLEGSSAPDPVFWAFDEEVDIQFGDVIEIVDPADFCAESYPLQCGARTATVLLGAEDIGLVTFGSEDSKGGYRAEAEFARYVGATVINTGEPFTDEELGHFNDTTVIESDGDDLEGHPDLPSLETPIILAVPDEEADKLAEVLFDQGYTLVINFHD